LVGSADVEQLIQEGDLVTLRLWPVDTGQPPRWFPPKGATLAVILLAPMWAMSSCTTLLIQATITPPRVSDAGKQK
jgi:hypothetical protein